MDNASAANRQMETERGLIDPNELSYFLERLVHDLREPLRSIHAYSELLKDLHPRSDDEHSSRIQQEICSGAARMRVLVDALSSYLLTLQPPEGEASLQLAFHMAVMALDDEIRDTRASVAGESLPRTAVGLERLTQLMQNLIENSLRFRSEASPQVKVTAARSDDSLWLIQVEDNGIGLKPDECEPVFRPFMRVHGRKYPGAGLGLTAAKRIVENHGGRIWIEPRTGGGCVCRFTLPAAD